MILSKPPQQADGQDALDEPRALTSDAPVGNWTWHGAVPRTWKPTYAENGTTREVVLHIHNPIGGEAIYRATDTYPAGSYDGKTETTVQRQLLLPARIMSLIRPSNGDKVWIVLVEQAGPAWRHLTRSRALPRRWCARPSRSGALSARFRTPSRPCCRWLLIRVSLIRNQQVIGSSPLAGSN